MMALDLTEAWPVDRVSAGWITAAGATAVVGADDAVFALASVTKPLFAYAVLVSIEEGTLGLDQPAGPEGATIRHLLAHASGLGDDPSSPLSPPGRRRIYSNAGYELLGSQLTAASGIPAGDYFREAVVEPLGMGSTELTGSPAHGAVSTVVDLLKVAAEWLAPTLISEVTMIDARSPQFARLPGVLPGYGRHDPNPWGLGFEIKGTKAPHWTGTTNSPATFGHFGRAGTFLWIDPAAGVACAALTDRDFGPWALPLWPALADAVLAEVTD
ncbi:MAG: beta-lactamase family protein [Acidimicrobiia bacterium]|nr:beta-lactamase family protein [Acidimicrobiia bacterium]